MLLKAVILHSLDQIDGERTVNSIYHLLKGKPSIQTIQDSYLFQLDRFFGLYKQLTTEQFNQSLFPLIEDGMIEEIDKEYYRLTPLGKESKVTVPLENYHWKGIKFHRIDQLFLHRLLLMIQVWTNKQKSINRYIPIIDDPQVTNWAKYFYYKKGQHVGNHLYKLYDELVSLLSNGQKIYPELFIDRITTAKSIGLTKEQLALKLDQSVATIHLIEKSYTHYLLGQVLEFKDRYSLLYEFAQDLFEEDKATMTKSAQQTAHYLKQGLMPEAIARRRNLKMTTIYDHIVEIALHDDHFPIENFVSEQVKLAVYAALKRKRSLKLKDIKESVGDKVSYFQIRLVLASINRDY